MPKKKPSGKNTPKSPELHPFVRIKNHPFIVPVVTIFSMIFLTMVAFFLMGGYSISPSDSHIVRLSIDGKEQTIPTRATTVDDLLKRASVTIQTGDVVEPARSTAILDDNFHVNIYRARPATIIDGDKRIQTLSAASTPRGISTHAGVQVYPEDNVAVVSTDNILKEGIVGQKIVIDRATPVTINLYGSPITVRTHAKTVDALLKEKGIKAASGDVVQPAPTTELATNMPVFIIRNGTQLANVEESIDMPIQNVDDANLSFGTSAIRQAGTAGKKVVTYQIDLQNGREVARHPIQTVIETEPVTQIVAVGKAIYVPTDIAVVMSAAGVSKSDYAYVNYIVSRESGNCATKWQGEHSCTGYHGTPGSSGLGYGLCQSTPASKMASAGSDWATNPVTQLKWCTGYASRYGGWSGAYSFWSAHGWW